MKATRPAATALALALGLLAAPLAAKAQQPGKVYRIGSLSRAPREPAAPYIKAFEEGLRKLGYAQDRNVAFEHRYANLRPERLPDLAAELVRLKVDVIVATSTPAALAAKQATTTIPIVMGPAWNPVREGLIASLSRQARRPARRATDQVRVGAQQEDRQRSRPRHLAFRVSPGG